jgi:hypothetical protein
VSKRATSRVELNFISPPRSLKSVVRGQKKKKERMNGAKQQFSTILCSAYRALILRNKAIQVYCPPVDKSQQDLQCGCRNVTSQTAFFAVLSDCMDIVPSFAFATPHARTHARTHACLHSRANLGRAGGREAASSLARPIVPCCFLFSFHLSCSGQLVPRPPHRGTYKERHI